MNEKISKALAGALADTVALYLLGTFIAWAALQADSLFKRVKRLENREQLIWDELIKIRQGVRPEAARTEPSDAVPAVKRTARRVAADD